jgi:hypothetical protein
MPPEKRQREYCDYVPSYSDCQRIFQAYEILVNWIRKGSNEWPGNHKELRELLRKSDWDKPSLRPFIKEVNDILNCGPNAYEEAKSYLKVRKILQFKSPEMMYDLLTRKPSRSVIFDVLKEAVVSRNGQDEVAVLRWCLQPYFDVGITPTISEIDRIFRLIGSGAPAITKLLIQILFAEKTGRKGFASLWREAMAKIEYHEIRREELERTRLQAVRAKIRAEIEDELRKKVGQELGFQDRSDEQRLIPESVKFEVWRRDGGKCLKCGSQRGLEFDHIIPFSKGGSNTARNIQLLCESCNRSKSNNI